MIDNNNRPAVETLPAVDTQEFRALLESSREDVLRAERAGFVDAASAADKKVRRLLSHFDANLPTRVDDPAFNYFVRDAEREAASLSAKLPGSERARVAKERVATLYDHFGAYTRR